MKKIKKIIISIPLAVPIYLGLKKTWLFSGYIRDAYRYKKSTGSSRFPINWGDMTPYLLDKTSTTSFEPHYTYHPAWAARVIARNKPSKHVDISSILHFSTLVSAFVPVDFYDFRPAHLKLPNLATHSGDLTALPFADNSIESISCMHTVEHIGLGRYGDPIDPQGDLKAIRELARVVAPGGTLLFVVPMGTPRLVFNAHRIYSYDQIMSYFPHLTLKEFSLIPDKAQEKGMIIYATKEQADRERWGCGCFWFTK